MSRRGAGSTAAAESEFEFMPAPAMARRIVKLAKEMLREGLDAGEVASLFTDAAQILSKQEGGMSRAQWLALCEELYDREDDSSIDTDGDAVSEPRLTAPGGVS